jgi:hypothetical protein
VLYSYRSNVWRCLDACMRVQTQRDFEELPAESAASLRDSLVKLFIQYGAGPRTVRMQLCVAIASLAVHVPSAEFGDGGVIGWLFAKLQHDSPPNIAVTCMLELLAALPQARIDRPLLQSLRASAYAANFRHFHEIPRRKCGACRRQQTSDGVACAVSTMPPCQVLLCKLHTHARKPVRAWLVAGIPQAMQSVALSCAGSASCACGHPSRAPQAS